jgi:hypothetical protein
MKFTTAVKTGGNGNVAFVYIGSATGDSATARDWIGMAWTLNTGTFTWNTAYDDGVAPSSQAHEVAISTDFTETEGSDVFVRLRRLSTTVMDLTVYSDSARTIVLYTGTATIPATVASLRYFTVQNLNAAAGTSTNNMIGYIKDLRVWDAITNPVTQETATFTEDFTSTGTWSSATANLTFDTATDEEFDWNVPSGTTSSQVVRRDMGLIDPKHWVLRCMWEPTSATANTDGTSLTMNFGFSDSAVALTASQDSITWQMDNSSSTVKMGINNIAGGTITGGVVPVLDSSITAKKYYIELSRDGDVMTGKSFTDTGFSVQNGVTQTKAIDTAISGLRYLIITEWESDGSTNGTFTGHLDDISFWDGISSPNAEGRKVVFTDNAFGGAAVEYASETTSYDPINGDWTGYVKIPSLATGADTTIQMYYDYTPSTTPSYVPEVIPITQTINDDFSTDNYTHLNGNTSVTGGKLLYAQSSADNRAYRSITTLDSKFYIEWETVLGTANAGHRYHNLVLSEESTNVKTTSSNDGYAIVIDGAGGSVSNVYIQEIYSGTINQSGDLISSLSQSAIHYFTFSRSGNELTVESFSDSARTVSEGSGSLTLASTSTGFVFLQHGTEDPSTNVTGVTIDNLKLLNGVSFTDDREKNTWNSNYKAVYHLQGNSVDSTVNDNDGTDTAVAWEQQNGSVGMKTDALTTESSLGSDTSIDNIWLTNGGHISVWFNAKSDGEGSQGTILDKLNGSQGWHLLVESESAGLMRIDFTINWTTGATWNTAVNIPINELNHIEVDYDQSSTSNDPVFIINGVKLTVGNGITETTSPATSALTDAAQDLTIGNSTGSTTFDGYISRVRISDVTRPSSEAITSYNAEKSDTDITTAGAENTQ